MDARGERLPPGERLDPEGSKSPAENSSAGIRFPVPSSSGSGVSECVGMSPSVW
jgi:hypothetical protein